MSEWTTSDWFTDHLQHCLPLALTVSRVTVDTTLTVSRVTVHTPLLPQQMTYNASFADPVNWSLCITSFRQCEFGTSGISIDWITTSDISLGTTTYCTVSWYQQGFSVFIHLPLSSRGCRRINLTWTQTKLNSSSLGINSNGAGISLMFPIELLRVKSYPAKSAQNLRVILDKTFNFHSHISATSRSCIYRIRNLQCIHCHLDCKITRKCSSI